MHRSQLCLLLLIIVIFLFRCVPAKAQFPQWHNYTSSEGSLDFELDGNDIWICSVGGLVKLNKSTGTYVNYNGGNFGLTRNELYRIETDASGVLFISGLNFIQTFDKGTDWMYYDTLTAVGMSAPALGQCKADKLGNVYAPAYSNYILRYNNSNFDTIQFPLSGNIQISEIDVDSSNHLWVATGLYGVAKYDGTSWQTYDSTNSVLPSKFANGICVDHNDKVYALFYMTPNQGVLYSFSNGLWVLEQSGISCSNGPVEMYADATNNIWITSENGMVNGIIKWDGTNITSFVVGLPSTEITEFQIDNQGNWFYTTDYGFYSYDGVSHRNYKISNSELPTNWFEKVVIDKYGVKWFAGYYGVVRFDGFNWRTFNVANSTLGWDHITDMYADNDNGLIWVTFNPGFGNSGISYYDGSNWNTITPTVSGGFHNGYSLTKDTNGNMWFIGSSGVAKYDYTAWTHYSSATLNSTPNGNIVADLSGNVFVASFGQGVWRFDGSSWQFYDSSNFAGASSYSYFLYSGAGGQVYAITGLGNIYVFDGTAWNIFYSPCMVQIPNTFSGVENITGDTWLAHTKFTSKYDGALCTDLAVSRLPDLSGMVRSVAKDLHNNYWFTYGVVNGGITVYNNDGGINPESLYGIPTFNASGFVYIDLASDGVYDTLVDYPFANRRLLLLPDSMIHFTNAQGKFNFSVPDGMYSIKVIQDSVWQLTSDSAEFHFTMAGVDTSGFNFGLMDPNFPLEQMNVNLTVGIPRCNTYFPVWIDFSNQGLNSQTGVLKYSFDPLLNYNGAVPAPDSINGNNLYWNISGLTTFNQLNILISMELDTFFLPPATHFISVDFIKSGVSVANEMLSFQGRCSMDPNDKSVKPEGAGLQHEIAPEQKLEYTIRFQNYGNDTAFYVMIIDTLSAELDFNTFSIKGSSHPCSVTLSPAGVLQVKYRNINLLWETIDAAASQGYFSFSIKPRMGIADGTVITNSAAIYFDFNLPVVTNEVYNTISHSLSGLINPVFNKEVILYPVPVSNELFVSGLHVNQLKSFQILDITGKQISYSLPLVPNGSIHVSHLQPGVYILRLRSESGEHTHHKFIVGKGN